MPIFHTLLLNTCIQTSGLHMYDYSLTWTLHRNTGINLCYYTLQKLLQLCIFICKTVSITWLVHDSKTAWTWYQHTQTKQLLECRDGNTFLLPSFLPYFLPIPLKCTSYHYLSSPSLLPLHTILLQCYPWNPCSLWVLENTHIYTYNSFYNYSYILLLEWSID